MHNIRIKLYNTIMEIEEYIQYHETKLHEQPGFSYNTYLCTIPLDFPSVPMHWHEQMEIIYIKKGNGTVSVGMKPYEVSAGCIIPVMPGELHSIDGSTGGPMEYENIIFSLDLLDSTEQNDWCRSSVIIPMKENRFLFERPIRPGTAFWDEVSACLDKADEACTDRVPGYSLRVKSSLFLFLYALFKHKKDPSKKDEKDHSEALKKVISYVKEHSSQPITIHDVASLTDYSDSHFMRLFKAETGRTFISFLNEYRLQVSAYMLKETKDPVSLVAVKAGFENLSYFIRMFTKTYGVPPGRYRKNFMQQASW